MANPNAGPVNSAPSFVKPVFIDTNLGTHLVTLVHSGDTVSSFKNKLLEEHRLCFPDVGDIEISALKVKRRGQFYHLTDTMFVMKAFEGNSRSWFLFLEVKRFVKEGENLQLQCVDSWKQVQSLANGFEPLMAGPSRRLPVTDELNHQQKSDHCLVTSRPSVYLSGSDKQRLADFDVEVEHSTGNHPDARYPDSDAVVENISGEYQKVSNPKLLEKEKYIAISLEFADGITKNEVKAVQQEDPNLKEAAGTELATTAKRKHKSKRKGRSWNEHALEGIHEPSGASPLASPINTRENTEKNADKASANADEFEQRDSAAPLAIEPSVTVRENSDIRVNSVEAGRDIGQHKDSENVLENAVLQTPARKRRKVEKKPRKEDSVGSMLNTNKMIVTPDALERPKVPNPDAPERANDHLETISGLTVSPDADKKRKRKKPSKDPNKSVASTTSSIDLFDKNIHLAIVSSETRAISPAVEKETEMAILNPANNLQSADFTSALLPLVQKSKKPDPVENYGDQNIGNNDKDATPEREVSNLATFTTKDDGEETGKRDNGELNGDETKGAKSSKRKKKSSKGKTPVEDDEGPDMVIRNVLESLQQSKENEESLENGEKKSKKKKKKQPLDSVEGLKETVGSSKRGKTEAVGQPNRTISGFENDTSISERVNSKALIPDTSNARSTKKIKEARLANVNMKGSSDKKEVVLNSFSLKGGGKNMFPASGAIFGSSSSEEDEPKGSGASTRTPSDASSDDSDDGETKVSSDRRDMSLEKILKSSSRFKKAKLTASQSQPDPYELLAFDHVPDSQAS